MTQYEIPIESKKKKSARIPIDKLHDFDGHPYKVTAMRIWTNLWKVSNRKVLLPLLS